MKKSKILPKLINSFLLLLLFVLFIKAAVFRNILSGSTTFIDFDSYYSIIQNIKHGINPYSNASFITLGPPTVFLYFFPFSLFKIEVARILTSLVGIILGFLLCLRLARTLFRTNLVTAFLVLSLLFFSSFPVRFSFVNGQSTIVAAFLLTYALTQRSEYLKGVFVSIAAIIKTFYILTIIPYLKNRKVILSIFLSGLLSLLISFLFIKPEWYVYYLQHIFPGLNASPTVTSGLDYYNQSLKSTFYRLGLSDPYQILFIPIVLVAAIVIFITQSFELSIITSILISPISWQYYYVSLFPLFVIIFSRTQKNTQNLFLLTIAILLWWIDIPVFHTASINLVNGVLASHFFISGVILYILFWKTLKTSRK